MLITWTRQSKLQPTYAQAFGGSSGSLAFLWPGVGTLAPGPATGLPPAPWRMMSSRPHAFPWYMLG